MFSYCKLFITICMLFSLFSCSPSTGKKEQVEKITPEQEIINIDKEIPELTKQLADNRLKAFNREMEAQDQMLEQWKGFSEKIKDNEEYEEHIRHIENRVQELRERKKILLKEIETEKKS